MGVLNKLKSRMTGRNALTEGPGRHHGPAHCDVDYMHSPYWDDMRKRNAPGPGKSEYEFETDKDYTKDFSIGEKQSSYTSGGDAVAAGLAAAANQPEIEYADTAGNLAEMGSKIGEALISIKSDPGERKKELDQLQKDNPNMTRDEARKKRRANRKSE